MAGEGANKNGKNNTAIGTSTDTLRKDGTKEGQALDGSNTKLVDGEGKAHDLVTSTEAGGSTAVGYNTTAEGDASTAIGNKAVIKNVPVTYYADADGNKTTSQDDAAWYKDSSGNPTKVPQVFRDANNKTTTTPQYIHTKADGTTEVTTDASKADKDSSGNPKYNYLKSDNTDYLYTVTLYSAVSNSIAAGSSVTSEGDNAVAVGYNTTAKDSSVAIGDTAKSEKYAVAIGPSAKATGESSMAEGQNAQATGTAAISLGKDSSASGENAVAIGKGITATGGSAVAIGSGKTKASNGSTAVGSGVTANNGASAFGSSSSAEYGGVAVGSSVSATGSGAAFGVNNTHAENGSVASGSSVYAYYGSYAAGISGTNATGSSVAVGSTVTASGSSFASGMSTSATNGSAAYGISNTHAESGSVAVGSGVTASNGSFAAGFNSTAGTNGGSAIAVGNNVTANSGSAAYGFDAKAEGSSLAIGVPNSDSSTAYAYGGSMAIGKAANAQYSSTAIGPNAMANSGSTAIGSGAAAYNSSNVFGDSAYATNHSLALGQSARANNSNSLAVGAGASVYADNGIALGSSSMANVSSGKLGLDPLTGQASTHTGDAAWQSTLGALSIGSVDSDGNATSTRQINGVAAGTKNTDAVNVAQLMAVTSKVSMHDYSVNSADTASDTNYNNGGASGKNALAAGVSAAAKGENSIAIGYGATADGKGATVIGQYGTATGDYALAFGGEQTDTTAVAKNNTASGANAVAFGERTTASGNNSTAFGQETTASEKRATAFGQRTTAKQSNATAFGQDTLADGQNATAFGNLTVASNYGATAFGNKNKATGMYATAWGGGDKVITNDDGTKTKVGTVASGTYATAFGERTTASGESATAFGSDSTASGKNATAFGENSTAAAENSLAALGGTVSADAANAAAIGSGAQAKLADSIALGSNSVADRASGVKGYDAALGATTTDTSTAWVSNANAIAVGNGSTTTRQITGVAAGSEDTDAVNLAQLKSVSALAAKHTTVSVGGNGATADNVLVKGGNLEMVRTTTDGQANYDVSLNKDITLGEQAENKGASLTVNSVGTFKKHNADGTTEEYPVKEAVKIDGTTVTVSKHDGSDADNDQRQVVLGVGQDVGGYIALYENTGKTPTYIFNAISKGITYLKDKNSYPADEANEFNRLEYGDITNGNTQFIATLDDGLSFKGDSGEKAPVKLNQTLSVTGGVTSSSDLASGNNIGVVSTPAVEDAQGNITENAKLQLKLAKDVNLGTDGSITAGTGRMGYNNAGTLKQTQNGKETGTYADAGTYVTGLTNKGWTVKNPTYVSGRAATEDELATVSNAVSTNTDNIATNATNIKNNTDTIAKGLSFTTNTKDATNTTGDYQGYKVVNRKLGDTIAIKAGDADATHTYSTENLTTEISDKGDITIKMDDNPTFNVVHATSVDLQPKDTTTKDQSGKTATAQLDAHYRDASLNPDKNVTMADGTTGMTRIHYHDGENTIHDLATMDDGQVYAGDIKSDGTKDTTGFARTMNQKTTIKGGVTDKDNLSDNNIGVVSNGTDTLTVKLTKNLTNLTSVTTGKTTVNDDGLTITNNVDDSSKNVVINGDTIAFGGNQVTNMGSGINTTTNAYDTDTNGANIGDVKNIANSTVQPVIDTVNKGWELEYNGTKLKDVTPNSRVANFAEGQNISISGSGDTITVATADDVRFNTVRVGGTQTGDTYSGGIVIGKQSGGGANTNNDSYITGLKNTNWDSNSIMSGRAATEDQLQAVAKAIQSGSVAGDVYVSGGGVSYSDDNPNTPNDGKGTLTLTRKNQTDLQIDGLHDYYITEGSVSDDGKTLTLTRNDTNDDGSHKTISVDLSKVMNGDLRLVANPGAADGKYAVTSDGTVTLKVQNADGSTSQDITIGGLASKTDGLKFGANAAAADGGANPVTNTLNSTVNITGAGDKALSQYSGQNLKTSVEQDADGNTTIHVLMDKDISTDTVMVTGKDGNDGQIGITGKNGADGTVTTIIKTVGKNGTNGTDGKPGVDGTNITRVVYQDGKDGADGTTTQTVATLNDGLKFAGDDQKVIAKKLNEQLSFVGGADKSKLTSNNIGINEGDDGKLYIQLVSTPNLGENGNLTAGTAQIGWFSGTALPLTDGTKLTGGTAEAGSYVTGLSNKSWNVSSPTYVSGRAATEDQLKVLSDALKNSDDVDTDYQLVPNPDSDDKHYKAVNGTVTLKVKDTAHPDAKAVDVVIDDIASKSKVDEAFDRTVKYNIDNSTNKVDKNHITLEGGDAGTQIQNMASGASNVTTDDNGNKTYTYNEDTNAANIGDVKRLASQGDLHYAGDSGTGTNKLSDTVKFTGTKDQITTSAKDGEVHFQLADDIRVGQKGADGSVGVDGSIGANGKDGSSVVLNGADGSIGLTGKDGKNGLTIRGDQGPAGVAGAAGTTTTRIVYKDGAGDHTVATLEDGQNYAGNFGSGAAVKLNKKVTIKGKLADGAKAEDFVDGNIAVTASQADENGELLLQLNKNLTGLNSATYTSTLDNGGTSTTRVDGSGLNITNGPSITNTGINAGNKVISNVADGVNDNDAVNVSQLKKVETTASQHTTVEAGSDNVTVTESTDAKTGGKKYTVDLADKVTFGDKTDTQNNVSIDGTNGTITAGNQVSLDGNNGKGTIGSVSIGQQTVNTTVTVKDPDTGKDTEAPKSETGSFVAGLDNKTWNPKENGIYSGRAATEDQLQQVEQNANSYTDTKIDTVNSRIDGMTKLHTEVTVNGGTAAATGEGNYTDGNLQLNEKTGKDGQKVYDLKLNDTISVGKVTASGEEGTNGKVSVNGKDGAGVTLNGEDGSITLKGKNGDNTLTMKSGDDKVGVDGKDGSTRMVYHEGTKEGGVDHQVATLDDGLKFAGDSGDALKQKLNSTTNIKGGADTSNLSDNNIGIVSDGNDTLNVKLSKDIQGLNSVSSKTFTVAGDDNHNAITIAQGNVNMGGNTVQGVAPGRVAPDSTDAVNGSQLYATNSAINKLGSRVDRVGAGAAALAALHPQDFDPDDKWDFAAGYGNYHGASAAAIGAFYRPTEDVMVSVGGSMGGGENMVNAGVTFKLGQHNHVSNSRVAMAKEIRDLKATVGQLTQMVNMLTGNAGGRTMPLKKGDTLFPDVPKNHWAYDYVTKLAQAGLLEGYPDGEFKGDRMMTRYEFATVIYRAIMAGAAGNPKLNQDGTLDKLVDEFGDELQYIRIVVIDRDKDGKPTIERVRTVEDDRKHHHGKEREQQPLEQGL